MLLIAIGVTTLIEQTQVYPRFLAECFSQTTVDYSQIGNNDLFKTLT